MNVRGSYYWILAIITELRTIYPSQQEVCKSKLIYKCTYKQFIKRFEEKENFQMHPNTNSSVLKGRAFHHKMETSNKQQIFDVHSQMMFFSWFVSFHSLAIGDAHTYLDQKFVLLRRSNELTCRKLINHLLLECKLNFDNIL